MHLYSLVQLVGVEVLQNFGHFHELPSASCNIQDTVVLLVKQLQIYDYAQVRVCLSSISESLY